MRQPKGAWELPAAQCHASCWAPQAIYTPPLRLAGVMPSPGPLLAINMIGTQLDTSAQPWPLPIPSLHTGFTQPQPRGHGHSRRPTAAEPKTNWLPPSQAEPPRHRLEWASAKLALVPQSP